MLATNDAAAALIVEQWQHWTDVYNGSPEVISALAAISTKWYQPAANSSFSTDVKH